MNKDSLQTKEINGRIIKFSDFWQTIASELGNSRFKINAEAESIKYFLDPESDHKDFLRVLIQQCYKRCRCYHLNARFDVNVALDVLGETSHTLQGTKEDDLLDIELLEEIAWLINQHYGQAIEMPNSMLTESLNLDREFSVLDSNNTGSVVSMAKLKTRRKNRNQ
jgi:hypothetical protein